MRQLSLCSQQNDVPTKLLLSACVQPPIPRLQLRERLLVYLHMCEIQNRVYGKMQARSVYGRAVHDDGFPKPKGSTGGSKDL